MKYLDVIEDIKKLVGLELHSIRPGANLRIQEVDDERGSIILKNVSGNLKSRSFSEIASIWNELMANPAVHVEGVLHGSGSSRNQPETIMANLPYIEWLKVGNKKHIAYVGRNTHAFGTLKQMDPIAATAISERMGTSFDSKHLTSVVVSKDINASISDMNKISPGTISTVEQGVYKFKNKNDTILFLPADTSGLEEGTYIVIETQQPVNHGKLFEVYYQKFQVINQNGIKAFIQI